MFFFAYKTDSDILDSFHQGKNKIPIVFTKNYQMNRVIWFTIFTVQSTT